MVGFFTFIKNIKNIFSEHFEDMTEICSELLMPEILKISI